MSSLLIPKNKITKSYIIDIYNIKSYDDIYSNEEFTASFNSNKKVKELINRSISNYYILDYNNEIIIELHNAFLIEEIVHNYDFIDPVYEYKIIIDNYTIKKDEYKNKLLKKILRYKKIENILRK